MRVQREEGSVMITYLETTDVYCAYLTADDSNVAEFIARRWRGKPGYEQRLSTLYNMMKYSVEQCNEYTYQHAWVPSFTYELQRNVMDDGKVYVNIWQRDCDCVEYTTLVGIRPTVAAWEALEMDIADGAEGPFNLSIVPPEDVDAWQPYERDRILEAFENGNNYYV
jgi:hypothetical protein